MVRRFHNRVAKAAMRTQLRKVREAAAAGDIEKAEQEFRAATKKLDRAGASRLIHPNRAARTKSRLQRLIKSAKAGVV
jgi:small subunit ribosomal protein S20